MAVQLIYTAVHDKLSESYVRPEKQRPRLDDVVPDAHITVVDLANLDPATVVPQIGAACGSHGFFQVPWLLPGSTVVPQIGAACGSHGFLQVPWLLPGSTVVSQIGAACGSHGFFQVLNHEIPVELTLAVMPEKAKLYSDKPAKKMRRSTSFNVRKETVHNWRDHLRLHHHPLEQFVPDWPANPPPIRLSEGTQLKSSGYGENRHESKMFALVAPEDGSSSSAVPLLWLDSGAAIHAVGDAEILTNLRDPPTEMAVKVADGYQLPITKVGAVQSPNINVSDVSLAPGLAVNLVSVHQLAKSKVVSIFYENYAEMWLEGERIGGAIFDDDESLYRLCFFRPHA